MTDHATPLSAGSLLVLSGPPGSGKTTIAQALADTADRSTVHVATDPFYTAIRKGFVLPFLPEAATQNEVVIGVIVEAMLGYAKGGYDVIVDGIVGPWSLPPFVSAAELAGFDLSFVVLRPSFEATLARAVAREGKALKASGPIKGLYGAFARLGALEHHAIDTTGDAVDATTQRVRAGMLRNEFSLSAV